MITIRKKLAEQSAGKQDKGSVGNELRRRQSIRSQLLTAGKDNNHVIITWNIYFFYTFIEAQELGEILPGKMVGSILIL